ncbi:hypothetical protein [Nesterenkonia haasae]|nr:hypothetical protein [Nesterenkonia haasae]
MTLISALVWGHGCLAALIAVAFTLWVSRRDAQACDERPSLMRSRYGSA